MHNSAMVNIVLLAAAAAAAAAVAVVTPAQGKELSLFLFPPIQQKFMLSCYCISYFCTILLSFRYHFSTV